MWWYGFRQIRQNGMKGIVLEGSNAVLCGPFESEVEANRRRFIDSSKRDSAHSKVFEALDSVEAGPIAENLTPKF